MENRKLLEQQYIRLLPLQIMLLAMPAVNGMISGIYGSNFVSVEAMSAIGLFLPVSTLVTAVGNMLLGGSQILCSRLIGENQLRRSQRIFKVDLIMVTVISISISAVLLICAFTGSTKAFTDSSCRLFCRWRTGSSGRELQVSLIS